MRTTFITLMIGCPALALVICFFSGMALKAFLTAVPEFRTPDDIEAFKRLVKKQMINALILIPLLSIGALLYVLGFFKGVFAFRDILYVIVPSVVVFLVGRCYKTLERKTQSIPVADPQLQAQRDQIVQTWLHKALPDW